ncbi:FecR family protein [Sphingobium phenoxybenzoativorans]|uniref:FecR family protein n=1 Tax=Sphingobium phenoxybenzoativorans TaxID=1592790 RepID=UPI000871BF05|nr:FecR domain-containing protein [Sphingobium phenoxybenzoativorans]
MSEKGTPPERTSQGQLLEEASTWFARMRGPDADLYQTEFDAWRKRGALHMAAYNRIAEVFNLGKRLADEPSSDLADDKRASNFLAPASLLVAIVAAVLVWWGWIAIMPADPKNLPENSAKLASNGAVAGATLDKQFSTHLGEIRTFTLSDGSKLTLDTDSLVTTAYDSHARRLRLERGRARFEVFHEHRSFVVLAGAATVTARGTIFDVWLNKTENVMVHLLRGKVDVSANTIQTKGFPYTLQLRPGQSATVRSGGPHMLAMMQTVHTISDWPTGLVDFNDTKLLDVVEMVNHHGSIKLVIGTPHIANLKVSGTFRINDPILSAQRLAEIFDLKLDRSIPGEILLLDL